MQGGRNLLLDVFVVGFGLLIATSSSFAQAPAREISDLEIWKSIIRDSIQAYGRSCPCPYSEDRLGQQCGNRSAYFRATSAPPTCYPRDISDEQIARYREKLQ
jgi:hypothetical protein